MNANTYMYTTAISNVTRYWPTPVEVIRTKEASKV